MREVLLTSSVLILALLLLRRVFRQKISRRVQYALWGLVLVRLLAPVSLPALDFSVLTVAEPVRATISARLDAPAVPITIPQPSQLPSPAAAAEPAIPNAPPVSQPEATLAETPSAEKDLTLTEVLSLVWLAGTAAMTVWLLITNLCFAAKLRRSRTGVGTLPGCGRKVYMVESGLASPCLFGVLRPAIYLTPSAAQSEASLRHVLAHEETHARHLDPLWSLLRGVCLAIYWFDPLVWIAASASKTDCELACDEGAIRRLGEEERLAYGKTLLSLIPIRRLPGNPLLSATTMSSDKKRLRDRITRIAENHKTRKLALCAMALLTVGACLITFAGCAEGAAGVAEKQDGPITAAELRYFNELFFNGGYMNIRNQFLSSMYDDPTDIDLFELFYCGAKQGNSASEEERAAYEASNGFTDCDIVRVSTAEADAVLLEYTGLTLEETNKVHLSDFTYLPESDAYFLGHGDTNYRYSVEITDGVREGDLLHLYYEDAFYADGWKCVTLREAEDGGYQFVSNKHSEKPVVPTVYPTEDPLLTIPLTDLTGHEPKAAKMVHHSNDCEERFVGYGKNWIVGDHHIQGYRSTNGIIYVAEITDEAAGSDGTTGWEADCFAVMPNDEFYIDLFDDLFGRDGFVMHYIDYEHNTVYQTYSAFDEDGTLLFLCDCVSEGAGMNAQILDLNGDGVNELLCTDHARDAWLFFQREGRIYEANITELLEEALPDMENFSFGSIDPYARCLVQIHTVTAVGDSGAEFQAEAFRNIYFDGESLLVYKQDKTAVNHVVPSAAGPEYVMAAIRDGVQTELEAYQQGNVDFSIGDAKYDDWRIISLSSPWYETFFDGDGPLTVEIYRYGYEFHAAAPEKVVLAGGMYIDEDGWFCPSYVNCDYLCFRVEEDGSRTCLFSLMENDCGPDDELFREDLERQLIYEGLLQPNR